MSAWRPLSDDQVTAYIADPATIENHEQALEVIETLDAEIASIQAQIDAAAIENNAVQLSPGRQGWLRRAAYAAAMRRNDRHRVMQRDKEIRGTKGNGLTPPKRTPEERLLKQQRLMEEAQARRVAKQADVLKRQAQLEDIALRRRELKASMSFSCLFVQEAQRRLPVEEFQAISAAVKLPGQPPE